MDKDWEGKEHYERKIEQKRLSGKSKKTMNEDNE